MRRLVVLAALALTCFASAASSRADDAPPAATPGVHTRLIAQTPLSDAPGKALTLMKVTFDPGAGMASHHHDGTVVVYVLSGAVRSKLGDGPARTYQAGESWIEPPGVEHVICANASATDPAEIVASLVSSTGGDAPPTDDAPPDTLRPSVRSHG